MMPLQLEDMILVKGVVPTSDRAKRLKSWRTAWALQSLGTA